MSIFTNDHFMLGLGLAAGPAIILCFAIYAFFKWGKSWRRIIKSGPDGEEDGGSHICQEHSGFLKTITFLIEDCKAIWGEIKDINKRQITLRQKLPEDYVSKVDLIDIKDRLKSIDGKLDRYLEISMKK